MSYFDPNNKSIIYWYRKGTASDPFVSMDEPPQVFNGIVDLSKIPDKMSRVKVADSDGNRLFEIRLGVPSENEYLVDYPNAIVYFNGARDSETLSFENMSRGGKSVSSKRVWTKLSDIRGRRN